MVGQPAAGVPRCLAGVVATRAKVPGFEEPGCVGYSLSGLHGETTGRLLGFDLRSFNKKITDLRLVPPLFVQWTEAEPAVLIFDSNIHGYHGELGASAVFRGSGDPIRFRCGDCGAELFQPSFIACYPDDLDELIAEDANIRLEDYFEALTVKGLCAACGRDQVVANLSL